MADQQPPGAHPPPAHPPAYPVAGGPLPPAVDPWPNAETRPLGVHDGNTAAALPYVVYVDRPRRRRWPWVLGTLATLSLLCCGLGYGITADLRAQYPAQITLSPDQIAGLNRMHSQEIDSTAQNLVNQIRAQYEVDDSFAIALSDPAAEQRPVLALGATVFILDPSGKVHTVLRGVDQDVTGVVGYAAGGLGGELGCGNGKDGDQPVVVCAWLDHGSIGVTAFYGNRPMDEAAALTRIIRDDIIVRG